MIELIDHSNIKLRTGFQLQATSIKASVDKVNSMFVQLQRKTDGMALDIFSILDFRMLSGLMGEALVGSLHVNIDELRKNPNIDGYPDLIDISTQASRSDADEWETNSLENFIRYKHGGIEVKNTFGLKKPKAILAKGDKRIDHIIGRPVWKAHHPYTNNLLAIFSDFIEFTNANCPQIVAVMYSDQLTEDDWNVKQNPRQGSKMTSFTDIKTSGWEKLKSRVVLCRDEREYMNYFGVTL